MNKPGQRLSDYDFFTKCLNHKYPELKGLQKLAETGKYDEACKVFAAFIRGFLQPEKVLALNNLYTDNIVVEKGETIRESAERILNNDMISCGIRYRFGDEIEWEYNPTPDGYKEWTWQLSRHHEFYILAKAYLETGDERYAKHYVKTILSWIEQAAVPENTGGGNTNCWRTIEVGIRMTTNWNYAIHTFLNSPAMTDRVLTTVFKSVWENGWRLRNFNTSGNWLIMEMDGLGHIGLLYPFFTESEEWYNYAVSRLEREAEYQLYPDGFQFELSTNYHHVVIVNFVRLLDIVCRMGIQPSKKLLKTLERMYDIYPVLVSPDFRLPDLNDGLRLSMDIGLSDAVNFFKDRQDYRFLQTNREEGTPPNFTSKVLPYAGIAIMRSDWSREVLWCMFESAPFGRGHQHEDKLSMELQAYGKSFLIEAGINAYDGSARHNYALTTLSHNTLRVDRQNQNRRARYRWTEECMKEKAGIGFYSCDLFDAAEGAYNEGYGKEFIDVTHIRRVLFLKNPKNAAPFFAVIDRVYNNDNKAHEYELIWHFEDIETTSNGDSVKFGYENGPSLTVFSPSADSIKTVRGQTEPEYQGFKASWDVNANFPIPTVLSRSKSEKPMRIVTLLCPSKNEKCDIISVSASKNIDDVNITINTINGSIKLNENDYFNKMTV